MSDPRLKHLLTQYAETEIPDNMDLRNSIHRALQNERALRQPLRLTRTVMILVTLLVTATAAYALYQTIQPDPGIEAVRNENLVVHFDQTQPLTPPEGTSPIEHTVNVTLEYAYADANRITVAFYAEALPADAELALYLNPTLTDASGASFQWLANGGQQVQDVENSTLGGIMSFDASALEDAPETLDLVLKIDVAYTTAEMRENDPMGMMLAGATTFGFSLPFNAGQVVPVVQAVTAADLEVIVNKVAIAPSLTRVDVCYMPLPVTDETWLGWEAIVILAIDGETVIDALPTEIAGFVDWEAPCRSLTIRDSLVGRTGEWTLTIDAFHNTVSDERIEGGWSYSFEVE
jgi:hypothetical protein